MCVILIMRSIILAGVIQLTLGNLVLGAERVPEPWSVEPLEGKRVRLLEAKAEVGGIEINPASARSIWCKAVSDGV